MQVETIAKALLADIRRHLPEAPFFQREDLLHLPALSGVATITRYRYVCLAVHLLVQQRKLVLKGRSDLCLASRAGEYEAETDDFSKRYERTIRATATQQRGSFLVMDVVRAWRSDQHLTENSKRIAVRQTLRRMAREGVLHQTDFTFRPASKGRSSKQART